MYPPSVSFFMAVLMAFSDMYGYMVLNADTELYVQ